MRMMRDLYKSTSKVQARYTYSAMGLRVSEQLDSLPLLLSNMSNSGNSGVLDGVLHANHKNADDLVFFIATDMRANICNQARVATYRGTDAYPKESFIHHEDRVHGPMTSGGGGGVGVRVGQLRVIARQVLNQLLKTGPRSRQTPTASSAAITSPTTVATFPQS